MAGKVDSKITLPVDTGNAGAKVHTSTVSVGAETMHRHHFVQEREELVLGVYRVASAVQSVSATAHNGTSTGFAWIHVPTAVTGKKVRIRKLVIKANVSAATPTLPTVPRVGIQRFTFTGTASGAQLAAVKTNTGAPAAVLDIRTAITGLTPTLVGTFPAFLSQTMIPPFFLAGTAADILFSPNNEDDIIESVGEEDEWPVLAPGEGLVLAQGDAGTASDTRRFVFDLTWDEIDVS
jgi:hypothetical protein